MKKTILFSTLCIALLSLSLVSCEKKTVTTDNEKVTFSPIGDWKIAKSINYVYNKDILESTDTLISEGKGPNMIMCFQEDGKFLSKTDDKINTEGTYMFSDDFSMLTTSHHNITFVAKVVLDGNDKMTMTETKNETNEKEEIIKKISIVNLVRQK